MKRFACFLFLIGAIAVHAEAPHHERPPEKIFDGVVTDPGTGTPLYRFKMVSPNGLSPEPVCPEAPKVLLDVIDDLRKENIELRERIEKLEGQGAM